MRICTTKAACTAQTTPCENIGAIEELYYLTDRISPSQFLASATISGRLDEETLRRALDLQQRRHPRLQVRIDASRLSPRFNYIDVPQIGLRTMDADRNCIESILDEELNRRLDFQTGPLMRSTLIRHSPTSSTVVILVSHCIADGLSLLQFLVETLNVIGGAKENASVTSLPVEALRWNGFNTAYALIRATAKILEGPWKVIESGPFRRRASLVPRKACTIFRSLGRDLTMKLVQRCRVESATVHSALCAAQLLAYDNESLNAPDARYLLSSAVNLREQLAPREAATFGVYATTISTVHKVSKEADLWLLAREIKSEVSKAHRWGEPFLKVRLAQALLPLVRLLLKLDCVEQENLAGAAGCFVKPRLAVSNLGVINLGFKFGELELEAVEYAVASPPGLTFGSTACTVNGILRWNFMYLDPLISRPEALAVADGAIKKLTQACGI